MKTLKNHMTLEEEMLLLQEKAAHGFICLREFLHILSGKGRFLLLILLSIPFCQPIQIPGLSTPFGLAIAFLSLRMAFGEKIWLPQWVLKKTISSSTIKKITARTLKLLKKMHRWTHPRLSWLCNYRGVKILNGIILTILGFFLALPIPVPLSNLSAAWSILLISWGCLEDDGIFLLIGYILSLLTIAFFVLTAMTIRHVF